MTSQVFQRMDLAQLLPSLGSGNLGYLFSLWRTAPRSCHDSLSQAVLTCLGGTRASVVPALEGLLLVLLLAVAFLLGRCTAERDLFQLFGLQRGREAQVVFVGDGRRSRFSS